MKIEFENVNFSSRSGPNAFGLKLLRSLVDKGHQISDIYSSQWNSKTPEIRLTFIQGKNDFHPNVLRLDGLYFNSDQDWKSLNKPIQESYNHADAVIVQSEFNRELTSRYFGARDRVHVIHNGTDLKTISKIPPAFIDGYSRENIWMCASAWRPHKRLRENIRLFLDLSKPNDILLIAGIPDNKYDVQTNRVKFLGDLDWKSLISCMKASGHFIHLAWLDHCPNVVVDARAAGCRVYCSSSGGTEEIAGTDALVLQEEAWDFEPVRLYHPPTIQGFADLRDSIYNTEASDLDINSVADRYLSVMYSSVLSSIKT